MTIQIRKKFGYLGFLGRVKLYINDKPITKLSVGDTYTYEPKEDQGIIRLKVKQHGVGSNTLFVRDTSKVTISINPYYTIAFISFFASLFVSTSTSLSLLLIPAMISLIAFIFIGATQAFVLKEVSE
ncbi:hypothetical protein [Terribacillus saccharophilus]|uniref:Uncharacterized protein n=1 Tax=Terribacillus saccharophilus TaxID=361277 RepID=A0ABX4GX77_9BACI|nr:hypothetical protein [Terribacillus saccharophilus]PAD35454.1 hypothetical protein CHH56_10180 [Terribacillus saccharophilus]PAD96209.1 hypothetical protein CHH50_10375 [Terribacillus saccharophilus]PAD99456.1 hypothetical protein CHH48_11260 [Terribacillus saccharophilus]